MSNRAKAEKLEEQYLTLLMERVAEDDPYHLIKLFSSVIRKNVNGCDAFEIAESLKDDIIRPIKKTIKKIVVPAGDEEAESSWTVGIE